MIIIAVSRYKGAAYKDLPGTVVSAQRLQKWAMHPSADRNYQVVYLGDDEFPEITTALVTEKVNQLIDTTNINRLVVYFAGHGIEYGLQNYIVPVDAPGSLSPETINAYYINMEAIIAAAETQGFSIFFLDACRSAVQARRLAELPQGNRASYFGAVDAPNSVVFYATAMGDAAYDAVPENQPLSPFATAVGRGISFPGLDLPYVFTHVREHVASVTAHFDNPQFPQFAGSWSRPFYFLPPGASPLPDIDVESREIEPAPLQSRVSYLGEAGTAVWLRLT